VVKIMWCNRCGTLTPHRAVTWRGETLWACKECGSVNRVTRGRDNGRVTVRVKLPRGTYEMAAKLAEELGFGSVAALIRHAFYLYLERASNVRRCASDDADRIADELAEELREGWEE